MMVNKKIIIIAVLFIAMIAVVGIVLFLNAKKPDEPTVSKVKQGETVTPDQTQADNQSSNQNNTQQSNDNTATTPPAPQTKDFYDVIVKSRSVGSSNQDAADFGIVSSKEPIAGWYVVTIKKDSLEPAKVIFHQTNDPNNPLAIVAGPGTYFPPESISLPDAVRKAL